MNKLYIGSDHAGFSLKESIVKWANSTGYDIEDLGPNTMNNDDDYPDYIYPVAEAVVKNNAKGIILGGSGTGEAIVANRVSGVRAVVFNSKDHLIAAREHNDVNIISFGARFVKESDVYSAIEVFLKTPFSNEERHVRRIKKIDENNTRNS